MGMCYSVEACIGFKNNGAARFCESIRNYISENDGITAIFQLEGLDLDNPSDCFRAVTVPNASVSGDIWTADFNASYGWESVMYDAFEEALQFADDGSTVTIWPDNAMSVITVNNGEVTREFTDYDELEDDEEEYS